jgi:transcriptional regulator with XRE-family HTH domain
MRERPIAPAGLWDGPEMSDALARRDMGAVVRLFRKWTGASQTDVGVLVGLPQSHISDVERGRRQVTALEVFERFADGLGIPRRMLGLNDAESEASTRVTAGGGVNYRAGEAHREVAADHRNWLDVRRRLKLNRARLTQVARALYPAEWHLGETGILMPKAWRLEEPVDLTSIGLSWRASPGVIVTGQGEESRRLRPLTVPGRRYHRYHRAMGDLDRPRLFENRVCYRLLDVAWPERQLTVGGMCYFDMIDVGEALAHELALVAVDSRAEVVEGRATWGALPFRRLVRDPFDLLAYPLMLSISTLTIRRSRAGATFLLLRRNPARVAIAGGMLSVMPTGVFQPVSVLPAPGSPDFDLWRNMMREYSEEFLGNPEHTGDGPPVDYETEEPFRTLDAARAAGGIRVYCLGIGIDALNYVGDVFTVAVFDADVFDHVFKGLVEQNDEGDVAAGEGSRQFTFDDGTIHRLLAKNSVAPSGAACLYLASAHKSAILGSG